MWKNPPHGRFGEDNPERLLERQETREALEAAFAQLPEKQRLVVMLRDVDGNVILTAKRRATLNLHLPTGLERRGFGSGVGGADVADF